MVEPLDEIINIYGKPMKHHQMGQFLNKVLRRIGNTNDYHDPTDYHVPTDHNS